MGAGKRWQTIKKIKLKVLPYKLSISKIKPCEPIPTRLYKCDFFSITKTPDEISMVHTEINTDQLKDQNRNWRAIKIIGPLDFSEIGIIASLTKTLADNKISVFVISTYNTDYILLKEDTLSNAIDALKENYHIH